MYLKRQYDMGLRLQVKIKFQTETLPNDSMEIEDIVKLVTS